MAKKNYYEILGISVDAPQQTIKQAYRAKAMASHPDRGGSHETMLAINEAYEILINPETRRHYDEARANQNNQVAQQQARADASQAQQQAAQYPRAWADFESWLAKDFTEAKYGQSGMWSTVENSSSGFLFIFIGMIAGVVVGFIFCGAANLTGAIVKFPVLLGAAGGGFIGQLVHRHIGESIQKRSAPQPPASDDNRKPQPAPHAGGRVIVSCPKCNQQLRAPAGGVRVRCPACRFEFSTQQ
jgi:hypothetical protein